MDFKSFQKLGADVRLGNLFGSDQMTLKISPTEAGTISKNREGEVLKIRSSSSRTSTSQYIQSKFDEINSIHALFRSELSEIKLTLDETKKEIKSSLDETKKDIQFERNNIIGSLSLFVAFFTFISINITIFSKVDNIFTALTLMFGMLVAVTMMLIVFFGFLHKQIKLGLFTFTFIVIVLCIFGYNMKTYFDKFPLSPSYDDRIKAIESGKKEFEEKIKGLEIENTQLKQSLEQKIAKEVELQLLQQQFKSTSN